MMRRSVFAPLVVGGIALATGGWFLQRGVNQDQNVYVQAKLFDEVVHRVSDSFVDGKKPSELYQMAIDGLLEELGDPHTAFMTPKDYSNLKVQTQGEYGGLGMQIGKRDGWITVIAPLPGTPAERAGVLSGDQIIQVNGVNTKEWREDEAVDSLRGPKGTPVDLKVHRFGVDEPIPFRIVRDEIRVRAVPAAYMMDGQVGYIELSVFSESSTDEVRAAVENLRKQGAKSLILDVRGNPGGLLDQGVSVSDLFLDKGQLVVETRSRVASQNAKAFAMDPDEFPGMQIAVLVGPFSASAAEILAGALQDHDRALVIGRTTYGKGSVQQVFPLSNQNFLKMTTARWYTPVGRSIQKPYGIDANHDAETEPGVTEPEAAPVPNDTSKKPAYRTDLGRTVYGGGGIHPDIVVVDSLRTPERLVFEALGKNWSKFLATRFRFAVRYVREHPDLKPGFAVTSAMLGDFYQALQQGGVPVERDVYNHAGDWVGTQLAFEISKAKFGAQEANRRANAESPEVQVAADLLRRSASTKQLFTIADAYVAQQKMKENVARTGARQ
jgi:carboxyl-terminal processing protease